MEHTRWQVRVQHCRLPLLPTATPPRVGGWGSAMTGRGCLLQGKPVDNTSGLRMCEQPVSAARAASHSTAPNPSCQASYEVTKGRHAPFGLP